ncbi:hypothetical protein ACQP04_12965 [Pseudonocardia halophobica]|uniref:hypothetical protein n=1 Tax=Pseudonocardia halophobica TaxID=29401 RepID=UPI003D8FD815
MQSSSQQPGPGFPENLGRWLVERYEFFVHLEDGSKADWLAGIGAIGALIFAFFAVRAAYKQNLFQAEQIRRLEDDQRERDADRRRDQASKVAIWWVRGPHDEVPYSFRYSNTSDLPVTEFEFSVKTPKGTSQSLAVPYIAPRTEAAQSDYFDHLFDQHKEDFHFFTGHGPSGDMAFIEFTDMREQRWRRDLSGKLTLLDESREPSFVDYPAEDAASAEASALATDVADPNLDRPEMLAEPKFVEVCPRCGVAFGPSNDFCPNCGAARKRAKGRRTT